MSEALIARRGGKELRQMLVGANMAGADYNASSSGTLRVQITRAKAFYVYTRAHDFVMYFWDGKEMFEVASNRKDYTIENLDGYATLCWNGEPEDVYGGLFGIALK